MADPKYAREYIRSAQREAGSLREQLRRREAELEDTHRQQQQLVGDMLAENDANTQEIARLTARLTIIDQPQNPEQEDHSRVLQNHVEGLEAANARLGAELAQLRGQSSQQPTENRNRTADSQVSAHDDTDDKGAARQIEEDGQDETTKGNARGSDKDDEEAGTDGFFVGSP